MKERNAVSPQPVEQNLLHIEKIFKDTVQEIRLVVVTRRRNLENIMQWEKGDELKPS